MQKESKLVKKAAPLDAILMENAKATGYADAIDEIKTEREKS